MTPKITGGIKEAGQKYEKLFNEQRNADIAGAYIEGYALKSYFEYGNDTGLVKTFGEISRLYADHQFDSGQSVEEIIRMVVETYNNGKDNNDKEIRGKTAEAISVEKINENKLRLQANGKILEIKFNEKGKKKREIEIIWPQANRAEQNFKPASILGKKFKSKLYTVLTAPSWETFYILGLSMIINPFAAFAIFVVSHIVADTLLSKDKKEALRESLKTHLNWKFLLASAAIAAPFFLNPFIAVPLSFAIHALYNFVVIKFNLQRFGFNVANISELKARFNEYKDEEWFQELFSGKYRFDNLTREDVEKIRIMLSFGITDNDKIFRFAMGTSTTPEELEKLRKYKDEKWFNELLHDEKYHPPYGWITFEGIERTIIMSSFGMSGKQTVKFAMKIKMTPEKLEELLRKYKDEKWFEELFSMRQDGLYEGLTLSDIENIRILSSFGISVNDKAVKFVRKTNITPKELEELLRKYKDEKWFQELFSGKYSLGADYQLLTLAGIERIRILSSFGISIKGKNIGFAMRAGMTPEELEELRKYKDEKWFNELLDNKYDLPYGWITFEGIERTRIMSSFGMSGKQTVRFAIRTEITPEKLEELLRKYKDEKWFKELFSMKYEIFSHDYDIYERLTFEDIERIRILSSFGISINEEIAGATSIKPEKLEEYIGKYKDEEWFQELFSGKYSIGLLTLEGIERTKILSSFGISINEKTIGFAIQINTSPEELEWYIRKYKDEEWFQELFSGKYSVEYLALADIKKIRALSYFGISINEQILGLLEKMTPEKLENLEIMKSVFPRKKINMNWIHFAINIKFDEKMLRQKKEFYEKMLSIDNLFEGTPQEVVENLSEGKLSFKELVISPYYAAQHNINKTDEESMQKLRLEMIRVQDIISSLNQYDLGNFFEARTNYTLEELLKDDNRIKLFVDEIIYAINDIRLFIDGEKGINEKEFARELDDMLKDYYFVRGKGIEFKLSMRNIDNYLLGDKVGDCTGTSFGSVNRKNFRSERLMHPDYEVLEVFIDGNFVMKLGYIEIAENKSIFIDSQEDIPEIRDYSSSYAPQREYIYLKAVKFIADFAANNGYSYQNIYNGGFSNSSWMEQIIRENSSGGEDIAYYLPDIIWQSGHDDRWFYINLIDRALKIENNPGGSKLYYIKKMLLKEMFNDVYKQDNGSYVIPVSQTMAMYVQEVFSLAQINEFDLSKAEKKSFSQLSENERKHILSASAESESYSDLDSLNEVSIFLDLTGKPGKIASKIADVIQFLDWDNIYESDGNYIVTFDENYGTNIKPGKKFIIKYEKRINEKLQFMGKENQEFIEYPEMKDIADFEPFKIKEERIIKKLVGLLKYPKKWVKFVGIEPAEKENLLAEINNNNTLFFVDHENGADVLAQFYSDSGEYSGKTLRMKIDNDLSLLETGFTGELVLTDPESLKDLQSISDTRLAEKLSKSNTAVGNLKELNGITINVDINKITNPANNDQFRLAATASMLDKTFKNKESRIYKLYTSFIAPAWETFYILGLSVLINPFAAFAIFVVSHIVADTLLSKDKKEAFLESVESHMNGKFLLVSAAIVSPFFFIGPFTAIPLSFAIHALYNFAFITFNLQRYGFKAASVLLLNDWPDKPGNKEKYILKYTKNPALANLRIAAEQGDRREADKIMAELRENLTDTAESHRRLVAAAELYAQIASPEKPDFKGTDILPAGNMHSKQTSLILASA